MSRMFSTQREAEKLGKRLAALGVVELRQLLDAYSTIVGLLEKFDGFRHNVLIEEADLSDAEKFLGAFAVFRKIIGATDDPQARRRDFWVRAGALGLIRDHDLNIEDASPPPGVLRRIMELGNNAAAIECAWLIRHDGLLRYEVRELTSEEERLEWATPQWLFLRLSQRALFVGDTEIAVWWAARCVYRDDATGAIKEDVHPVLDWDTTRWWRKSRIVRYVLEELAVEEPVVTPIDPAAIEEERKCLDLQKGPNR